MRLYLFVRIQSSISDRISLIIISFSFYGALLLLPPPVMLSTQFVLHKPNWPNGRFWQKYNFASVIQGGRAPLKIPVTASSPFENGGLFAKHTPPAPTLTSSATVIPNGFDNYRRQSTPPAVMFFFPAAYIFVPAIYIFVPAIMFFVPAIYIFVPAIYIFVPAIMFFVPAIYIFVPAAYIFVPATM